MNTRLTAQAVKSLLLARDLASATREASQHLFSGEFILRESTELQNTFLTFYWQIQIHLCQI